MLDLKIVGRYRDTLKWVDRIGSERVEDRGWAYNQIQDSALGLIVERIIGGDEASGTVFNNFNPIRFMGVCSGDVSWDNDPSNVTKPVTQTTLTTETHRFALAPDDFKFLNATTGAELNPQALRRRFKATIILGSNDANGDLREFGLFGGDATATLDSGVMFNWITHPLISKDQDLVIERVVDITLAINRS